MADFRRIFPEMADFFDTDFFNMRERFNSEMRRMDEEMARFHHALGHREGHHQESITNGSGGELQESGDPSGDERAVTHSWLDSLNSPLVEDVGDAKHLKLKFNVSHFKPEEIVLKTKDDKLMVHAKHEEKTDHRSFYQEFNQEFRLPKGTDPESIKSSLSKDGVLTVEAPIPAIAGGEKLIPIKQD